MKQYLNLLQHVIDEGSQKGDRTGTGTLSVFGHQMRFNLEEGFPLVTTKTLHIPSIVHELLWFLSGDTNIKYLNDNKVTIWNEWADHNGELGPVYGSQWRSWPLPNEESFDQISDLIERIKSDPNSRRHIVSAWNVSMLENMALPPCHCLFQFYIVDNKISCQLYQRSADIFLGVPFNIASYSLLLHLIAKQTGYDVGEFIWTGGDCHLYLNHIDQAMLQLERDPMKLPVLKVNEEIKSIFDYKYEDIEFENYRAHEKIVAPISV